MICAALATQHASREAILAGLNHLLAGADDASVVIDRAASHAV